MTREENYIYNKHLLDGKIMDDEELELENYDSYTEVVEENEDTSDTSDNWDDYDRCYECGGYGDDYYYDIEKDELVSNCPRCPYGSIFKGDNL